MTQTINKTFSRNAFFEYNRQEKQHFLIWSGIIILLISALITSYLLVFRYQENFAVIIINSIISHVQREIASSSILGVFYTTLIGGLFFIIIPIEVLFVSFLLEGIPASMLITFFISGLIVSFSANYFLGMKLSAFSKKIITPQKFYKIKGLLNRYGVKAILLINLLPFFPAQPLSTILGVFRYNKSKFYLFFIVGQTLKFTLIALAYIYIIGLTVNAP